MNPELAEAMTRYSNASEPDVTYVGIQWSAFERYLRSLEALDKVTGGLAAVGVLRPELDLHQRARRVLRTTPLAPAHTQTRLSGLDSVIAERQFDGPLQVALDEARTAARALLLEEHPAAVRLAAILAGTDRVKLAGNRQIRAVTMNDLAADVAELVLSLAPAGTTADACGRSQAKLMPACDLTIIFGSPENLVAWQVEPEDRPRHVSWLFNAPMSPRVLVLSWPGNSEFNVAKYEPTPTSDLFDPRMEGAKKFATGIPMTPEPVLTNRPKVGASDTDNLFDAIDIQLPDSWWISFGLDAGPRAVRIDEDTEFGVEIEEKVQPRRLRRGNTLVIVKGADARDLRNRLCFEWVSEHRAPLTGERAMETVDVYRTALRGKYGSSSFLGSLISKGFEEGYARNQLARAWDPSAMAPQHFANFEAICKALGLSFGMTEWQHIMALRSGFMSAGRTINEWLKAAIRSDYTWQDTVEQQQTATIKVEGIGMVQLAPVLAVAPDTIRRPITQLGDLFK